MAANNVTTIQITYRSNDIQPPLFVAGTFSDPPWTLQEMTFEQADRGEHVFTKTIQATVGSTIQYKFRVGIGDWWVLDESAPTVTDDAGNHNNLLDVVDQKRNTVPEDAPTKLAPVTPFMEVDATEQQDSYADAEFGPEFPHEHPVLGCSDDSNSAPLFAYEVLTGGGYSSQARLAPPSISEPERSSPDTSYHSDEYFDEEFDPGDPTLERFPSSRDGVLEKVRTIETGLEEDKAMNDGTCLSPVVAGPDWAAWLSAAGVGAGAASPGQQSWAGKRADAQRSRMSRDSLKRSSSGASLHCIVEENPAEEGRLAPTSRRNNDNPLAVAEPLHPDGEPAGDREVSGHLSPASAETEIVITRDQQQSAASASPTGVEAAVSRSWLTILLRLVFVDCIGSILGRIFRWRSA